MSQASENDRDEALESQTTESWRRLLTGEDPVLKMLRRFWGLVPSPPRCKVCAAPFTGPGSVLTRVILHGRASGDPLLCNMCCGTLKKQPGGAVLEISVLFADVRGSTAIAERTDAARFGKLLQQFYRLAIAAIEKHGGVVDKLLGDGVMALFLPMTAGERHAAEAIAAGRALIDDEAGVASLARSGVGFGVGLHTGRAFVGVLGAGEKLDFSALGDTVNTAARLGALAQAGELLASRAAWERAGLSFQGLSPRTVDLVGRRAPLEIVGLRARNTIPAQ
jgi:adenylate cyclase